jgi:hypothetical protein
MKWLITLVVAAGIGYGFAASAPVAAQDVKKGAKPEPARPEGGKAVDGAKVANPAPPADAPAEKVQVEAKFFVAPLPPKKAVVVEKRVRALRFNAAVNAKPAAKAADAFDHPFLPGLDDVKAAPVVVAAPAQPVIDPLVQQFLPQFRQLMRTEINLVQAVCKLSKDQRIKIDKAGGKAAQAAAKQYGEFQQKMMQGQWNGHDGNPEPRDLVRDSLATILKTHLSRDQQARYKEETEQRKSTRKRVAVQNLIAKLDEELVLSAEQREKLGAALLDNWQDAWSQSLEMFLQNDQFFPNIPDQIVTPFLNKTQKQVWQGMPKNGGIFFGNFGLNVVFDVDELVEKVEVENAAAVVVDEPAPDPKEKKKPE